MSENTVSKYVRSLEEKGFIRTEPTMVRSKDGRPLNGNLLYTIRPIQAAIELFYERQFRQLEEDTARQRATERLAESPVKALRDRLWAAVCLGSGRGSVPAPPSGFRPVWAVVGGVAAQGFRPFCTEPRDERKAG